MPLSSAPLTAASSAKPKPRRSLPARLSASLQRIFGDAPGHGVGLVESEVDYSNHTEALFSLGWFCGVITNIAGEFAGIYRM